MKGITWSDTGNKHTLVTAYGKAIITRTKVPDELNIYRYSASFEPPEGEIILSQRPFISFSEAEAWVLYGAILETDLPFQDEASNNLKINTTLDYCTNLLPADIHPTHLQRLKIIRDVLHGTHFYDDTNEEPSQTKIVLDWEEQDSDYFAQTLFGTAHIAEKQKSKRWNFGGAISYLPRIVYEDTVVLHGFPSSYFDAAEAWILKKLGQFENPTGGKTDLNNLVFTLHICDRVLPEDTDLIHPLRLHWIEGRIAGIIL